MHIEDLNKMTNSYLFCAIWCGTDSDNNDEPLDKNFDVDDFIEESKKIASEDCEKFYKESKKIIEKVMEKHNVEISSIGHDFYLSRNGHGAGFFDRGWGKLGDYLQIAARRYKETYVEIDSDDNSLILN